MYAFWQAGEFLMLAIDFLRSAAEASVVLPLPEQARERLQQASTSQAHVERLSTKVSLWIDGLRAVAVLSVIVFHAFPEVFGGVTCPQF